MYDMTGSDDPQMNMGGGGFPGGFQMNMDDLLNMGFGGGGGFGGGSGGSGGRRRQGRRQQGRTYSFSFGGGGPGGGMRFDL